MSNLMTMLKLFHIQQDRRGGCSMASWLMIRNCILNEHWTQEQFRNFQEDRNDWVERVEVKLGTINSGRLANYIADDLSSIYNVYITSSLLYSCEKIKAKHLSLSAFKKLLNSTVNIDSEIDQNFIIFNFDAHYSPLGDYDAKNEVVKILDVDCTGKYDKEFFYGEGEGELISWVGHFYKKLVRQNRSFLLIKKIWSEDEI